MRSNTYHKLRLAYCKLYLFLLLRISSSWGSLMVHYALELCHWKRLKNPLDSQEIQPVNFKGNQFWIIIERTDTEAEAPTIWPPDVKSWLIGKDPDDGKYWRQEEKRTTEDELVGWHHHFIGHELGQTEGVSEGQGSHVCSSPWVHEDLNTA